MKIPAILATGVAACLLLTACSPAPRSGIVISNVTVISPERDAPLQRAHVRLVEGKIAELSERPLRGETEIDGTGRFLIPGLIDSHVHLALPPGFPAPMTREQAAAHPDIVATALEQEPRSYLFFGFTTVIDLVGTAGRTAQWNARELRPDAYFCGFTGLIKGQWRRVLYPYFSYGIPWEERMAPVTDAALQTQEAQAAAIAAEGAICVKTVHDDGLPGVFDGIAPSAEELRRLVTAAHARNIPVLIHANRRNNQAVAVAAGVDVIVHGMWLNPGQSTALDADARAVLDGVMHGNIGYQPTTQVIAGFVDMHRKDYLADSILADAYPPSLIALYKEGAAGVPEWIRNANAEGVEHARGTVGRAAEVTRILAQGNARLLFGSDTPSDLIYTNPPGLNGRVEMGHWIAAGVSPRQLFRALTLDNARAFHLEDKIGTVETGKTANLLLLRASPLESVGAYDNIDTVFLHGRPIPRAELSARHADARK